MAKKRPLPPANDPDEQRLQFLWTLCRGPELDAVAEYLDWCRAVLGLRHWEIYVADPPADDPHGASILAMEARYIAPVRLGRGWVSYSRDEQASKLLHEVLHVAHNRLTEVTRTEFCYLIDKRNVSLYDLMLSRVNIESELMVDQLSTALALSLCATDQWLKIRAAHGLSAAEFEEPIPLVPTLKAVAATTTPTTRKVKKS